MASRTVLAQSDETKKTQAFCLFHTLKWNAFSSLRSEIHNLHCSHNTQEFDKNKSPRQRANYNGCRISEEVQSKVIFEELKNQIETPYLSV